MDLEVGPDVLNEYPRTVSSTCPILFGLYLEVSRTLSSSTTITEDVAAVLSCHIIAETTCNCTIAALHIATRMRLDRRRRQTTQKGYQFLATYDGGII